jgi:hypothetical protein
MKNSFVPIAILGLLAMASCAPAALSDESKSQLPIKLGESWRFSVQENPGTTDFSEVYSYLDSSVYKKLDAVSIINRSLIELPISIRSGEVVVKDVNLIGNVEYVELRSNDKTGLIIMTGDPSEYGYNETGTKFTDSYINITFYPDNSKSERYNVCLINFWASEAPKDKLIGDLEDGNGYCELQKIK